GEANPIRTLGYYSKPSHEGYQNTIELPKGAKIHLDLGLSHHSFPLTVIPPGRTAKLQKDILTFQQCQDESLCNEWNHFKDLLRKDPQHGLDLWLQVQIFYDNFDYTT
ncbi:hypothetical protein Tco_0997927, partial [Tanacetum coccineum]